MRSPLEIPRRATDRCFAWIFILAFLLQCGLAVFAILRHADGGFAHDLQRLTSVDVDQALKASAVSIITAALAGAVFIFLLAYVPVQPVIYGVTLGAPLLLLSAGALELFGIVDESLLADFPGSSTALFCTGLVCILGTCFSWRQIQLATAVLQCTSAFLRSRTFVGLCPALFALIHASGMLIWVFAAQAVTSLASTSGFSWRMQLVVVLFLLLLFLWGSACVTALSTFSMSCIVGDWFTSSTNMRWKLSQLGQAMITGLRCSGSLALGSLLLATVRLLNLVLWFASKTDEQIRRPFGAERREAAPSLVRSIRNFAAEVLEAAAFWASKQAFIQVALTGCSFSVAAVRAAKLAATAPAGFIAIEVLTRGLLRAAELLLMAVAVASAALCGSRGASLLPPCFVAWLVAESFLHPYSVATSTILQCCLLADSKTAPPEAAKKLLEMVQAWQEDDLGFAAHYQP